ncbi:MAG TPA: hypothetical protein VFK88_01265 [Gallionella sp.]|nr:hypothetical protein [Gallionella sp.]
MNRIAVLLFVVLALSACGKKSSPYDTVIPQNEAAWEAEFRLEIRKLGEPDQKLLTEYLARAKKSAISGQTGVPSGMTIGAAIAEQKKFNDEEARKAAEAKARKARLRKERADQQGKSGDVVGVKVMNIEVLSDKDYPANKELLCQLSIENKGKRDISQVMGRLYFYDTTGREVAHLAVRLEEGIKGNSVARMQWKQDYNRYSGEDSALAEWATSKYKSVFVPEAIVFADGEKMVVFE